MKLSLTAALAAALASGTPCATHAQQGFPERPIRIVVPATAGGTQDTLARLIAPKLSEAIHQPVVIENRNGAGGMMGAKGQPEFLLEIAAGRIHYGVGGLFAALALIKDGKLLPLAVTTEKRSTLLPDVPTSAEVLPGWGRDGTQGVLAPSRTPRAVVQRLNQEVARVLGLPETRDRFQAVDFTVVTSTPDAFDRMLRSDIEVFAKVAKAGGLIAK
jgi:tripartite-type tricarboxylate transporter receptor subunit TctC